MLKNLSRRKSFPSFKQLFKDDDNNSEDRVPKGYVAVMVGDKKESERAKLFFIHVDMFKKACLVELLKMAADEFGYEHQGGVLQIPCDAAAFIKMVKQTSRWRPN
ncbi:auxin-induced protein 15A-like [Ricinus communis]|uniref:Calmodulin binding protein n=1 Tax=Ricinus communis TaxID=3988 RepID=B9SLV9_RICCO|nr:auxin-induced protein 15A-like [Ricinus communis]EEF35405.1 conserved hypothetical protein [Ricinus communis]